MISDDVDTCRVIYGVIEDAELQAVILFAKNNDHGDQKYQMNS